MNICFLNPPFKTGCGRFSRESRSPSVSAGGALYYPLWLIYAAALAEKNGHTVVFLDACAERMNARETLCFLRKSAGNCGLFVIDTSTPSIRNDLNCVRRLKALFPGVFFLAVGTHPSALPLETLASCPVLDGVARREFDETVSDLADALEKKRPLSEVLGISYRNPDGSFSQTPDRPFLKDLDLLPFAPTFIKAHLNVRRYLFPAALFPSVQIFTGRGCPFCCTFCVCPQTLHGHVYRERSAENVVAEFLWIKKNLPEIREVVIEDDTFTADPARVQRICRLLISEDIRLPWLCNARIGLDYETMVLMKKAGCRLIIPGVESMDNAVLKKIHKGTDAEKIRSYMTDAKRAGLRVHACYMAGNPGDTKETLEKTLREAIRFQTDSAQFYPMTPYPGTEAYAAAREEGLLKKNLHFHEWLKTDGSMNCIISRPGLSSAEIAAFCERAKRTYYFRPDYILRRIVFGIKDPEDLVRSVRLFFNLMHSLIFRRLRHG